MLLFQALFLLHRYDPFQGCGFSDLLRSILRHKSPHQSFLRCLIVRKAISSRERILQCSAKSHIPDRLEGATGKCKSHNWRRTILHSVSKEKQLLIRWLIAPTPTHSERKGVIEKAQEEETFFQMKT
jgi:hypothetical protein